VSWQAWDTQTTREARLFPAEPSARKIDRGALQIAKFNPTMINARLTSFRVPAYSVFDSALYRKHTVKWLFPQEKATFDAISMSTSESKTF
jgi:hypothetical protein